MNSGVISYLVVIFFIFVFIRRMNKIKKNGLEAELKNRKININSTVNAGANVRANASSAVRTKKVKGNGYSRSYTGSAYSKPHKNGSSYGSVNVDRRIDSSPLRDDRTNDWLARQLRDEHIAFKKASDMFGLKIEHSAHCDAQLLKNYHNLNCDAKGIDMAKGK